MNRSPLVRVPSRRGRARGDLNSAARILGNPYLAFRGDARGGYLTASSRLSSAREPVDGNIAEFCPHREQRRLRYDELPGDLHEACDALEGDGVIARRPR
jgi:glutamine synthetase